MRGIAARAAAGNGSQRYLFGWLSGRVTEEVAGIVPLTPAGASKRLHIFPPAMVSGELARTPDEHVAVVGQVSVHAKNRRTRRAIYLTVHRPGHGFTQPAKLAGRGDRASLGVAVTPRGRALAVWARNAEVFVRERFANGRLGPARRLTRHIGSDFPTVALAPNGAAAVAWLQGAGIALALRPAGGKFGPPRMLEQGSAGGAGAELAAYGDGRIQLAWIADDGEKPVVRAAQARGSDLGPVQPLSDSNSVALDLAIGRVGETAITWLESGNDGSNTLRAAVQPPGAAVFGAAETVAGPLPFGFAHLAFDPRSDRAVVAWEEGLPTANGVFTASREPVR